MTEPAQSRYALAMHELFHAPDRSMAIVAATLVEEALAFAIRQSIGLVDSDPRAIALFGVDGPLGSYSAKVKMGHALDLFGDRTKTELGIIGKVRNFFAHHLDIRSFDHSGIADRCRKLSRTGAEATPRDLFYHAATSIAHNLEFDALLGGDRSPELD